MRGYGNIQLSTNRHSVYSGKDLINNTFFLNHIGNKGNNKITELRTILQRESQNS
jgi:hypothetical protein